jgi:response regulator of citrate/malate metabolism
MMEKVLPLRQVGGSAQLWTRDLARGVRSKLNKLLDDSLPGDVVVIDASGVEVFDYSFANELFGKSLLSLPNEYPDRFLIVENLTSYTRENLDKALESLNLAMIERKGKRVSIIGKINQVYLETLILILKNKEPLTANAVKDQLNINLTAANERLSKLVGMSLLRREKGTSSVGREQYLYSTIQVE